MITIEAIIVTLMLALNVLLSFAITLEAAIQNNLTKSWRFSRETSLVEFCYSMKLQYSSMVIVKPLSLGFTVILLIMEAVVRRCFSKQVFFKNGFQNCNFVKKRFQHRFFPVRFAKFLRAPLFLRNTTSGGCFWYDSETYDTVKLYLPLDSNFFSVFSVSKLGQSREAVVRRCSLKECSQKFHKIHRKTPMQESLF